MAKMIRGERRGKRDGLKYYSMKGVEQTIEAKINEGMSNRVKTAPEYANTRLNNAEFGAAGSAAGAMLRHLPLESRTVLAAFPAAKLGKEFKRIISMATADWGKRGFSATGWQQMVVDAMNRLSKNSFIGEDGIEASGFKASGEKIDFQVVLADGWGSILGGLGADGVVINQYKIEVTMPTFDAATGKYSVPEVVVTTLNSNSEELGDGDTLSESLAGTESYVAAANTAIFEVVVLLPYKELNNKQYILQELCDFKYFHVA